MDLNGLALCSRYSYPPNSFSLCGPGKQNDLLWYSTQQLVDKGTGEILSQFSTLYPYLALIARANNLTDPFDRRVVEAYWLGNNLLHRIPLTCFISHLTYGLRLKKKIEKKDLEQLLGKLTDGALPHHSFQVLNVYKRTGHLDINHTLQTMDACLINWGQIVKILPKFIIVETQPLTIIGNKLSFGHKIQRNILIQGTKNMLIYNLQLGDWVSYHWGYFCQKLTPQQFRNLIYYTNLSLRLTDNSYQ